VKAPFDVIIVLGASLSPEGDLGPALGERVYHGIEAWRSGQAALLLMTGKHEAMKMKARAVKYGVPEVQVLTETTARTTRENALRCAELMHARRLGRALIVTQAFHRPRAVAAFRRCGVDAEAMPFIGLESAKLRLREVIALAVYKLRGWV
jgi:uncharacterized SAM-binding protein YcdF (DUF218 family)